MPAASTGFSVAIESVSPDPLRVDDAAIIVEVSYVTNPSVALPSEMTVKVCVVQLLAS